MAVRSMPSVCTPMTTASPTSVARTVFVNSTWADADSVRLVRMPGAESPRDGAR